MQKGIVALEYFIKIMVGLRQHVKWELIICEVNFPFIWTQMIGSIQICLESMYNAIIQSGSEMLICDYFVEWQSSTEYRKQKIDNLSSDSVMLGLFDGNVHGSLCNKLIKTQLYKKFSVHFIKGLNFCEDLMINLQLLKNGIKVDYLPKAFYHYDQFSNNNSLTRAESSYATQMIIISSIGTILENNVNREYILFRQKLLYKRRLLSEVHVDFETYSKIFPEINICFKSKLIVDSLIVKASSYKCIFNLIRKYKQSHRIL
jgi:hypothetical protein